MFLTGEQEITARTAGLSTVIILSTMIPLLLLIIIIFYRHLKRKNQEIAEKEKEIYFAEIENRRQQMYERMQIQHQKREMEISEYLDEALKREDMMLQQPSTSSAKQLKVIDVENTENVDHGDETDDEFFEMPLPPIPPRSPSALSGQTSITDNEAVEAKTPSAPSTAKIQETPKVDNILPSFDFHPPVPLRKAPTRPPPFKLPIFEFDPTKLPPVPPRPPTLSPPATTEADSNLFQVEERRSSQPLIVDVRPKTLIESDF